MRTSEEDARAPCVVPSLKAMPAPTPAVASSASIMSALNERSSVRDVSVAMSSATLAATLASVAAASSLFCARSAACCTVSCAACARAATAYPRQRSTAAYARRQGAPGAWRAAAAASSACCCAAAARLLPPPARRLRRLCRPRRSPRPSRRPWLVGRKKNEGLRCDEAIGTLSPVLYLTPPHHARCWHACLCVGHAARMHSAPQKRATRQRLQRLCACASPHSSHGASPPLCRCAFAASRRRSAAMAVPVASWRRANASMPNDANTPIVRATLADGACGRSPCRQRWQASAPREAMQGATEECVHAWSSTGAMCCRSPSSAKAASSYARCAALHCSAAMWHASARGSRSAPLSPELSSRLPTDASPA